MAEEKTKNKLEIALQSENAKLKRWRIEKRFEYSGFSKIQGTWLIYHDDEIEAIQNIIRKNKITFKGNARLIPTTRNIEVDYLGDEAVDKIMVIVKKIVSYDEIYKEGDYVLGASTQQVNGEEPKTVL